MIAQTQRGGEESGEGNKLQRISTGNWEKTALFFYKILICHIGDWFFVFGVFFLVSCALSFPPCMGLGFFFLLHPPPHVSSSLLYSTGWWGKNKQMEEGGIKRQKEEGCKGSN